MADTIKVSNNQDAIYVEVDSIPGGWSNDGIFYKTVGGKNYKIANDGNIRALNAGVLTDGTDQTSRINTILAHAKVMELIFDAYNLSITVSGTVTIPSGKKLVFRNGCKLIGTGTIDGGIVVCDDLKQCFASTLTVTNLQNAYVSVRWFGAVPDTYYDTGYGTDNTTAFNKAIASQTIKPRIYIPYSGVTNIQLGSFYYCASSIEVDEQIELFGDGAQKSVILFQATLGIWLKWGSSASHLHDFGLAGGFGSNSLTFNSSTQHGLLVNSNTNDIERLMVYNFSGDGIRVFGDVIGTPYTNANNNKLKNLYIIGNGRAGLYFNGGDSNNCSIESVDASGNAQVNIWDSSFLGNYGFACHTASAAHVHNLNKSIVSHGGSYYAAIQNSLNIEPGVTSGWANYWRIMPGYAPSFFSAWNNVTQYYLTAGYYFDDTNQLGLYSGCYGEQDQVVVINSGNTRIDNGYLGLYGSVQGSIGMHTGILTSKNYQIRDESTGHSIQFLGDKAMVWAHGTDYPLGLIGDAAAGVINSIWANGASGSDTLKIIYPNYSGWASLTGRDRAIQGNHVALAGMGGLYAGFFDFSSIARLISFGSAAPTSGEFGVGDIVINTNTGSSTLFWQCSVASVAGNGGTWVARTGGGGGGGGGETLADTLALGNSTGGNDIAVEWLTSNRKIDFRYDANYNQGIEFQTTARTMKLYSNTGDSVGGDIILAPENRLGIRTPSAPSYDVEIYGSASSTNGIYFNPGAGYTGVPNPGSVQGVIINVRGFNLGNAGVSLGGSYQPNLGLGITDNSSTPLVGLKQTGLGTAISIESGAIRQVPLAGTGTRIATLDANGDMQRSTIDPASLASATVQTLNSQFTNVANSGTSETDLMTYSLPGGTLAANGDRIELEAWFSSAANANNKSFKFKFGAYVATISSGFFSSSGGSVKFKAVIVRTGAATQKIFWEFLSEFGTDSQAVTSGSETLSGAITTKFTGQSDTASNDLTQNMMTITYYKA